jgi:hypothetical protein
MLHKPIMNQQIFTIMNYSIFKKNIYETDDSFISIYLAFELQHDDLYKSG